MKIAIDLESVIADIWSPLEGDYREDWGFESRRAQRSFDREVEKMWSRPSMIPLEDDKIRSTLIHLMKKTDIDVVTNRDIDERKIDRWFDHHDLPSFSIRSFYSGFDKTTLDYRWFVDDNPKMIERTDRLILRDQPWNESFDHKPRIDSFDQIIEILDL